MKITMKIWEWIKRKIWRIIPENSKQLEYEEYENCFRFIGDDEFRKTCMKNLQGEKQE